MEHSGVVVAVRSGEVDVEMTVASACSRCSSRSRCFGDSESSARTVTVGCDDRGYEVGQNVRVAVCAHTAGIAVALCYVLPLLILVAAIAVPVACGAGEPVAALCALAAVGIYYSVLWMFRTRISRKTNFKIHK